LGDLADDHRTRGVGEPLQFIEMVAQIRAGAPALERRAYEKRTLDWLLDVDWTLGDLLLPFPPADLSGHRIKGT
jgi:hypothetical protein